MTRPPNIEGWILVPGEEPDQRHYRPDPRHRLHPYQEELRRRPHLVKALQQSPELAAFVAEVKPAARRRIAQYKAAGRGMASRETQREAYVWLERLQHDIQGIATEHRPSGVDPEIAYHWLMGQLIPPHILARHLVPIEPVTLLIDRHGVLHMRFTAASQRERERYGPLIELAQQALGYPKDAGGNRAIADDPAGNERARTAAKLAWMGLTNAEIADFFEWPAGRAGEKRAEDHIATGKALLAEEESMWPEQPDRMLKLRKHRRSGMGPPWRQDR
jgi:hypothetical protein